MAAAIKQTPEIDRVDLIIRNSLRDDEICCSIVKPLRRLRFVHEQTVIVSSTVRISTLNLVWELHCVPKWDVGQVRLEREQPGLTHYNGLRGVAWMSEHD
jgi:hypothetical protein